MNSITTWWNSWSAGSQLLAQDTGWVLLFLILGSVFGNMARDRLKAFGGDDFLSLSWMNPKKDQGPEEPLRPSDLFSYLFSGTFWFLGAINVANRHGAKTWSDLLLTILGKGWTLGLVVLVTVLIANVVTRAVVQLVKHPTIRDRLDAYLPAGETRGEGFSETLGRFLGTVTFSFLFLLVVMTLAELAGLKSLGGALEMLWGLALRLISVSAALAIGCLGVLGARTSSTAPAGPASSSLTMPGYAGLGLIVVTTILAIDLLTAAASSITWIAILVLLGVLLMPAREYLLDIWAGFALEHYGIRKVRLESQDMKIVTVGFLNSTLETPTLERPQHPNRVILAAHFQKERDGGLLPDPRT